MTATALISKHIVFQGHLNDSGIHCITACLPGDFNCSSTEQERDAVTWWLPEWLWSWWVLLVASSVLLLIVLSVIVACRSAFPGKMLIKLIYKLN